MVKPWREVGPGGNPLPFRGPVVLYMSSHGDGAAHLRPWLRILLVFWWNQGCWLHLGIIRGTPCSTVATVVPGHSSGGSGSQGCRGYGQTSWPQWTQHPAFALRVGLAVDDVETSPRGPMWTCSNSNVAHGSVQLGQIGPNRRKRLGWTASSASAPGGTAGPQRRARLAL